MQATLEGTDRQVFGDLLCFAKERHPDPEAAVRLSRDGYHRCADVRALGAAAADVHMGGLLVWWPDGRTGVLCMTKMPKAGLKTRSALPPSLPGLPPGRVPTALVLAGGVNSADHTSTFPNLAKHLRDQVGGGGWVGDCSDLFHSPQGEAHVPLKPAPVWHPLQN